MDNQTTAGASTTPCCQTGVLAAFAQEILSFRGESIPERMVALLTSRLGASGALVGALTGDGASIRTLALWVDGVQRANVEYPLEGSPCAQVLADGWYMCAEGAARRFPELAWLTEAGAENYVGMPIVAFDEVVGIVAVFGPMRSDADQEVLASVLPLAAGRCAHEFQRRASAHAKQAHTDELEKRLDLLSLQARISKRLLETAEGDFDETLRVVLGDVCDYFRVGRASIAEFREGQGLTITQGYTRPGLPDPVGLRVDTGFPWFWSRLCEEESLLLSELPGSLPPEAERERDYVAQIGMRAIMALPLQVEGRLAATLFLGDFAGRSWGEEDIRTARIFGEIILNAVLRKRAGEEHARLERQLRHNQKLEALGRLAGGVAHDFNNMLAGIMSTTELVAMQLGVNSPHAEELFNVLGTAQRAQELVKQILIFSRTQPSPRVAVETTLQPPVRDAIKLLTRTVPSRIEIQATLCTTPITVHLNAEQLYQTIINLGTNAHHAIGDGEGRITITVEEVSALPVGLALQTAPSPQAHARIRVCDDGRGMSAETVERIFDPFFTTKRVGEGTGMGMSVVHGIVGACGGRIHVESEEGAGTQVDVYLPVVAPPPVVDVAPGAPPRGTERIILVDDEPAVVRSTTRVLEFLGYTVRSFTSPVEALQAVLAAPDAVELLLTDQTMPELSGRSLILALADAQVVVPAVLCTGYDLPGTIDDESGAAILLKPFSLMALATTVRATLDAHEP